MLALCYHQGQTATDSVRQLAQISLNEMRARFLSMPDAEAVANDCEQRGSQPESHQVAFGSATIDASYSRPDTPERHADSHSHPVMP